MKAWKMHVINFDDNERDWFIQIKYNRFYSLRTVRYSVMWEHIISHHDERDYVTAMNWIGFTPDKMHLLFVDMPTETHKNYVYE